MEQRFVARNSPSRLWLMLLGAFAFVLLGLWIAGLIGSPPKPGREWLGWVAALFFGFAAFKIGSRLSGPAVQIVVDGNGIFWRPAYDETIPWSAIRTIRPARVRHQRFLCLYLKNPAQFPRTGVGGALAHLNKQMAFGDVAISATGTDQSFEALLVAVERYGGTGLFDSGT